MILSSIIVEALARRAKTVVRELHDTADIADFRVAFNDELARFDNAANAQTQVKRARLLPDDNAPVGQSIGKGVGQVTGGTAESARDEALKILKMIGSVDWDSDESPLSPGDRGFISREMYTVNQLRHNGRERLYGVTGKQLFYLRDLRNRLVEKGLL